MNTNQTAIDLRFTTIKKSLPDFIYEDIAIHVRDSNTYHRQSEELITLISNEHALPTSHIRISPGNDASIFKIIARYGQETHVFTPTYIGYHDAKVVHGRIHEHEGLKNDRYEISTDHIPGASLIFVANPNNPFGITAPTAIEALLQANPKAAVVVDEAYAGYADISVISLATKYQNLIVLRSFSKDYALAGFRCGYMIANPDLLETLEFDTTWFDVSYPAVGAAISALRHAKYFQQVRNEIIELRYSLETTLSHAGYSVMPSHINASTVKLSSEADAVVFSKKLAAHRILVAHGPGGSNLGLDTTFVRIAIGTAEQMQRVNDVLSKF